MIYLDTSALAKLLFIETESDALEDWLQHQDRLQFVTSALASIELLRACQRADESQMPIARALLKGLSMIPINEIVIELAATIAPGHLRSLDAIHLASAYSIRESITHFVTYDHRLGESAQSVGLHTFAP